MKKYFKIIFLSLLSLLTMLFTHGTANADGVKELTNVITSVELLNASDTPQTTDSEGVYQVRTCQMEITSHLTFQHQWMFIMVLLN